MIQPTFKIPLIKVLPFSRKLYTAPYMVLVFSSVLLVFRFSQHLAARNANVPAIVGASIYGFTFLMLFTFSTTYHGFQQPQVKKVLEIFDHISIYFLIAGTYTPFILIYLRNSFGYHVTDYIMEPDITGNFF